MIYESIISKDPKHADALHMLGALTLQRYRKAKVRRSTQPGEEQELGLHSPRLPLTA